MNEQLIARLEELKRDYAAGEARLMDLERQQGALRETMLRIAGAIQVIQELLTESSPNGATAGAADEPELAVAD
ncbi:MAG TPA: hypothetical protein VFH27_03910 [Longimicrobiaceae bacterium]|nr:hypothetical protein [Longimicrobiaceae bacterium]